MINTTDDILILEENEERLVAELRSSLLEVRKLLLTEYNATDIPLILNKENKFLAFVYHFTEEKIKGLSLSSDFISNILKYTEEKDGKNVCVEYGFSPSNILIQNFYLKIGLKLVLLSLWKKNLILLPIRFFLGGSGGISENLEKEFDNDILNHFRNYFGNKNKDKFSADFLKTFITKSIRVLRTTNYQKISDVIIEEISDFHMFLSDSQSNRLINQVPKGTFFIEHILIEVKKVNPSFNFDPTEYRQWLTGFPNRHERFNYVEYQNKKEYLKEYRRTYNLADTKKRLKLKNENEGVIFKITQKNSSKSEIRDLNNIVEELTLEEEFLKVSSTQKYWNKSCPIYRGYEHVEIYDDSRVWVDVFNKFLEQRQKNGYETTKVQSMAFNFMMDYIYFYLKNWIIKNGDGYSLPTIPKDFKRTIYLKTITDSTVRPFTLLELLELKTQSSAYRNSLLSSISMLFEFVADHYDELPQIWDSSLKNPIRDGDFYMGKKSKKTNKVIIPKKIYPYLKRYLSSLENFGEFLLNKFIEEDFEKLKFIIQQDYFNCEEMGYVPIIEINNNKFPIKIIPNIYQWRLRVFDRNKLLGIYTNEKRIKTKWIPSNTMLRSFILTLNTGLRSAQVLWLDIRTWDGLNEPSKQQAYYKLNVNTDKFKNEDWTTFISYQVRNSLLKEVNFQNSMQESFMQLEANYKGREYSRFSNILPLFRIGSKDGMPIMYEQFLEKWTTVLWGFQNFINEILNENYELITLSEPTTIKIQGKENKYCPLSVKAVHTPHSMRATFCTHMAEYLERTEIAELVGHASDLVTSEVYIKPEEDVLKEKLSRAIDILDNGVNASYFEKNGAAHIKPNLSNSSLQKAFSQNREQTIELFNITSISLNINKESEEQSQKAIRLLKDARMDQVVFESTHICPVGGMCPQEVMNIIAEKRRCGLCPLALKCVDNLNPIYAKQRDLMREIKNGKERLDTAVQEKESEIAISEIEEKVNLDIRELVSWKFSAEILSNYYEEMKRDNSIEKKFYVEMPDMVKNHLIKVSVSNEKEYLLTRLADANSYSQFNNPENKYRAELLRKDIIRNLNLIDYQDLYVSEEDKIEVFCAMIHNMLESNKIGLNKLVEYDCFKIIDNQKSKQKKLFNNKQILLQK